jgi:hypothetical protein
MWLYFELMICDKYSGKNTGPQCVNTWFHLVMSEQIKEYTWFTITSLLRMSKGYNETHLQFFATHNGKVCKEQA